MLKEEWAAKRALLESELERELNLENALDKTLAESMRYSLMAGGKRLRPVLLMEAAEAVGGRGEDYIHAACALEMIHTYSLIHDDLPAMDNDDYRRGKLTNHKVYGAGIATLAGDALLTLAFEVILRQKADSETLCRVIREISQAAGPDGMVGGQAIDMESEGKSITMDELRKMHMGKTGALFRAAIRSGAILAGAGETELNALTRYAEAFGLAFQITDDILDVIGDENEIGKPVGSDERNHKSTYVTLTSLENARQLAKDAVDEAVLALEPFGDKAWFLKELVEFLISRKK
ncbi:polyprenyl synthetase family protein [Schwartzia succinivorans]|jgi:geranylgeranyl diphosphate synthase type II|uniref:Farnesyl diphosphate synthase n=1 Tax=Schwartzia succinivorans DSM 10502 TaxID=1123243 RepID=A0A1M4W422_9FIRM|nr:farnesyl diphosphate synthase [Schwartzia succinivorans]SHE75947.1 geranylgeranyl diphosphate synthase, type II [Schwartzia succinivorans DSM 10502]